MLRKIQGTPSHVRPPFEIFPYDSKFVNRLSSFEIHEVFSEMISQLSLDQWFDIAKWFHARFGVKNVRLFIPSTDQHNYQTFQTVRAKNTIISFDGKNEQSLRNNATKKEFCGSLPAYYER